MKTEGYLFGTGVIFFALVTPIYWFLSKDPTGTTALSLSFGLAFLISFYALYTSRRLPAPRPEDRTDAEIADGAGTLGFFSPHSWWPLYTAASAAIVALGVAIGWWLAIIGAFFLSVSIIGLVFEYYRGPAAAQDR